jgi:hypothetical protein
MSITFPLLPRPKSIRSMKPMVAPRQLIRQLNFPKSAAVSNEQIAAVNTALHTIENRLYYSSLKYISIAHSPAIVEVKSPGVGQHLKPVYLPIVYNTEPITLPRNTTDISGTNWDNTRQKLDHLRRHQNKELCIQSDTLYITSSAKQDLRGLDIVHQVYIGDTLVGEAFVTNSSRGSMLYYRIYDGSIVSKVLYQEFLVRLPRTIERVATKMQSHGYNIPSLLGDEFVGVIGSRLVVESDIPATVIEPMFARSQEISQLTQSPKAEEPSEIAAD